MRTLALVPLLAACAPTIPDGIACTKDARASAVVSLRDELGQPIVEGEVGFSTPGTAEQACEALGDGRFVCGWEVAGPMTLRADAWGYSPVETSIEIGADECHVQTEEVELTLPWVACPDVELWAVRVTTVNLRGAPVFDARVEAMPYGEMWTSPEPCPPMEAQNVYGCGLGWIGEVEVWATSREWGSFYEVVDVPYDECGPLTVDLVATISR